MAQIKEQRISFVVTDSMVQRFAALVGDMNPLHMQEDFAATSAYRERIAHGFLPLCFLLALEFPSGLRLHSLKATFQKPVFLRDTLVLQVNPGEQDNEFLFRIVKEKSQELVTEGKGEFTVSQGQMPVVNQGTPEQSLLKESIQEHTREMKDIKEGMSNTMSFAVLPGVLGSLELLLKEGLQTEKLSLGFSPLELASLLLCSPSVGMIMPGTFAILHGFEAVITDSIELETPYEFKEQVTFVSPGTSSFKKEFTIGSVVQGTITAGVGRSRVPLPSFTEIKKTVQGMDFEGKTVLITGANSGIGATCAMLFAARGAQVAINYVRGEEDAEQLVKDITKGGGKAQSFKADITSKEQIQAMIEGIHKSFGAVDVLVNNAARDFIPKDFLSMQWEDVQRDIDVMVRGSFYCSQAVIPGMIEKGGGRIITIGSAATETPPPRQSKYVIAKSGLVGLTKALAVEYAKQNILVNMVAPNMVETDLIAHIPDGFRKKIAAESPSRRYATPLNVAQAVAFLASKAASYTTGQKIMVTGGD